MIKLEDLTISRIKKWKTYPEEESVTKRRHDVLKDGDGEVEDVCSGRRTRHWVQETVSTVNGRVFDSGSLHRVATVGDSFVGAETLVRRFFDVFPSFNFFEAKVENDEGESEGTR